MSPAMPLQPSLRLPLLALALLVGFVMPSFAAAQVARSAGAAPAGADTARLQQQLQQATAERAQLQVEVTRLRQELEAAKRTPAGPPPADQALRRQAQVAAAEASRLRASNAATDEKLVRTQAKLDELVGKYRETATALNGIEQERNALQTSSRRQERDLTSCVDNNAALVTMNDELLQQIERTGFWQRAAAAEPFTRLKRTQLENLAAENRARAADLKMPAPAAPAAVPQP